MSQPKQPEAGINSRKDKLDQLIENVKQLQVQDKKKPRFDTYVFMKLKATGSFIPGLSEDSDAPLSNKFWDYFNILARSKNPEDYKAHFNSWKKHRDEKWTPTLSDIAFLPISAKEFEGLIALDEKDPGFTSSIQKHVKDLTDLKQNALDMDVPRHELQNSQDNKSSPYQFHYRVESMVADEEKVSFQDAWNGENGLRSWLEKLPKPVCLVAHYGFFHDFCALYCDLRRIGASVPDDVYYADPMMGVRNILRYERYWCGIDLENKLGLVKLHWLIFRRKKKQEEDARKRRREFEIYKAGFKRAPEGCRANLEVVSTFGEEMLQYIDEVAVQLNMTSSDGADYNSTFPQADSFFADVFSKP